MEQQNKDIQMMFANNIPSKLFTDVIWLLKENVPGNMLPEREQNFHSSHWNNVFANIKETLYERCCV